MVTPRWLRERRRAERRAARPDALAAELARWVAVLRDPGRPRTVRELLDEQGVEPFDAERWLTRESGLSPEDWAELRAAMWEGTGR